MKLSNVNRYVIQEDIQLVGEVWNNGVFDDKLIGTFNISVLNALQSPFFKHNENINLTMVNGANQAKVCTV